MRSLVDVLTDMLEKVPETEVTALSVLKSVMESAAYAAPEAQVFWWRETGKALSMLFPVPDELESWQQEVVNIFMGKVAP